MGDEKQRQALRQALEQFNDADAGGQVERADRLVGKQQLRPRDDGSRDGDALALAARELVRIAAEHAADVESD